MEYEFISTLRQRFDLWERQNQAHPVLRQEFQKIETLREQLKLVLNPEQFKIFLEWEESSNWIQAKEKERLFYQGIMEGLQFCSAVICAGQVPLSDYDE